MKKIGWLLGVFLIGINAVIAQGNLSNQDTPKLTASRLKWSKKTRVPRAGGIIDEPSPAINSGGKLPEQNPTATQINPREFYAYEADFKNETGKKIKGFVWEYIFLDADGQKELERYEFYFPYKVEQNKQVNSRNELSSPPLRVIDVANAGKNAYTERAEIKCVIFYDDSIWKRADALNNVCERLKKLIDRHR